ncbi:hypothetical protein TNCV_4377901 [Trichonephila clavipes]|nr:hypothetical protein TNCV_4377901 [Trichonephila clavipes]
MEYRYPDSPSVKKLKTLMSATKVMITIFWDSNGVFYTEFLTKGFAVNFDRFGTVEPLVVPKMEGEVERSTFFIGCRSSGSHAQMDTQPTRIFLYGQHEEMDRTTEKMCSC